MMVGIPEPSERIDLYYLQSDVSPRPRAVQLSTTLRQAVNPSKSVHTLRTFLLNRLVLLRIPGRDASVSRDATESGRTQELLVRIPRRADARWDRLWACGHALVILADKVVITTKASVHMRRRYERVRTIRSPRRCKDSRLDARRGQGTCDRRSN